MDFTSTQILIPIVVSALITAIRQISAGLDGPRAYWASIALNIVAQVSAQLLAGDGASVAVGAATGAALGLGTGAVIGPGITTSLKRIGLGKLIKPRQQGK